VSRATSYEEIALEPNLAESFFDSVRGTIEEMEQQELPAVLVVSPLLRPWLARLLRRTSKDLTVLCYTEIPDDQPIRVVSSIEVNQREDEQT
jgi:flagellar biosynthesis protein FlhA